MRTIFCLVLTLTALSSSALAAPPTTPEPVTQGIPGQLAFDDLATYYATRQPIPALDKVFTDLQSSSIAKRTAAAQYIDALLKQSVTDDANGRARWQASPLWGVGPDSLSRAFRSTLLSRILGNPQPPELAPALLWVITSDTDPDCVQTAATALAKNPDPQIGATYQKLLTPGHPNTQVLTLILQDAPKRRLTTLLPDILPHCNDPRTKVRQAARDAATALGATNIPDYSPLNAMHGYINDQLKAIPAMLRTDIPLTASFKNLSVKGDPKTGWPDQQYAGWLLSQSPDAIVIVDLFGQQRTLTPSLTSVTDSSLDAQIQAIKELRSAKPTTRQSNPRSRLSARGDVTAQFEPGHISLPEILLAAWALQRGNSDAAADIVIPCMADVPDQRWLQFTARDLLATQYHQEMLDIFTTRRNYPQTIAIAAHLARPEFKGWGYYDRTQELAAQLKNRDGDFKTFTIPTEADWQKLTTTLDRPAQIQYLAKRIRLINAFQQGQPGGVDFYVGQKQYPPGNDPPPLHDGSIIFALNPLVSLEKMNLQPKDVPALIPLLDDENFLLAYGYWRDFHPSRNLFRVNQFIVGFINEAACEPLINPEAFASADIRTRQTIKDHVAAWAAQSASLTRNDVLLQSFKKQKQPDLIVKCARELLTTDQALVLPAVFERIAQSTDQSLRDQLAESCYYLAPKESLAQARQWLADPNGPRFWAALILFTQGDREKLEGLNELAELLAKDNKQLTLYASAFEPLMAANRPETLTVAAGVLKLLDRDFFQHNKQTYVQRLFLAGRQEALDYLTTALDNPAPVWTSSADVDGKRVEVKATRADDTAILISRIRSDKFTYYPLPGQEQALAAKREALKPWLKEQMDLLRAGKPSLIKTNADTLSPPSWSLKHDASLYWY